MKICKTCKEDKSLDNFGNNKKSKDGLNYVCNDCRATYELNRRIAKGISPKLKPKLSGYGKECLMCHKIVDFEDFPLSSRGRMGRGAYCNVCYPKYHKERKAKDPDLHKKLHREYTQKYRDNNREHWRGLHRINQFNRKNLVKAVDDGTVTKEFMIELYGKENCHWCGKHTPECKRTAEHIIPLIVGGIHGISNLTMACLSCNASKINFKDNDNSKDN